MLRKQNPNHDTLGGICCRITLDGVAIEVGNMHIECRKSMWDAEGQRLKGNDTETKRQNRRLLEEKLKLERVYEMLVVDNDAVTAQMVKEFYTGKRLFRYNFEQLISEYFKDRKQQLDIGRITDSTLVAQKNYSRNFVLFLEERKLKGLSPLSFEESHMNDLKAYLFAKKMGPAHTRKICIWVKSLYRHSCKKKRLKYNPIADYEIGSDGVIPDTSHLSVEQLSKLAKFDFMKLVRQGIIHESTAEKCGFERDAFVFNCFTGMHHCDYTDRNFRVEMYQGAYFLKGYRRKTQKEFMVKLLEPAVQILAKYGMQIENLPMKSNQKRNDTLKQIAALTRIPVLLTTKIARKTFADIALNELMMDTSDVQACLGLTSEKYLRHYVRMRENRLLKKMTSWNDVIKKTA